MSCLLVTPNEELLFDEAMIQTKTLRFHKLSKLLKQRTKELMAKFLGFFRKSKEETLTMKMVDEFIMGLNSATSNTKANSWVCYPTISPECNPCKEDCYDDDCDGELYEECCNYREDRGLDDDYTESEYSFAIAEPIPKELISTRQRRGKPSDKEAYASEPKKWYEKGAIVLPF